MRKKRIIINKSDVEQLSTSIHIKKLSERSKELDYIIASFYDTFNTWDWLIDIYDADYLGYCVISTKYIYGANADLKVKQLINAINGLLSKYYDNK